MLNDISADLGVSVATSQWLSTGYILSLGVFVPLAPFLFKRTSERTLIMLAMALVAAGSLAMILAPSFEIALVARVMQAAGISLILPTMQTMIMVDLPKKHLGLFMGINGISMGFMVNVGPTIGGAMAGAFGWRSFFWLFLSLAVILAIPTLLCGRKGGAEAALAKFDAPSFLMCSFAFIGILLGFSNASRMDLTNVLVWLPIILGSALLVVFVMRENRLENPLISMQIFANKQFRWGFIANCLLSVSFVGVALVIPLYVQDLKGGTALDAGMVMLPASVVALVVNVIAGIAMDHFGARKVLLFTGSMLVVGAAMAVVCDQDTSLEYLAFSQAVRAVGISGSIGPLIGWALADLPRRIVSDGSSFLTVVRQAAASLGTSIMVLLIVSLTAAGQVVLSYQAAYAFSLVFAVATLAVIVARVR